MGIKLRPAKKEKCCWFCGPQYIENLDQDLYDEELRGQWRCIADGLWTSVMTGIDRNGFRFIFGYGDDYTERYYPRFCPECGRRLPHPDDK